MITKRNEKDYSMEKIIKKSSDEWHKEICNNIIILDPDGWDRENFYESWNELITEDEFMKILSASTCTLNIKF